ncbi:homoserine kinase [Gemella sp. ND 6198]|uniref:homoserine kinase n=1 Tax=Gemella sp. ND 6198 TaxID=2040624 RepID=UPI000E0A9236|nr:homoserine kinase [Gemella sp. ND 6198]AXI26544.1 homoserine kinase [Gemella sp. ND 6198]
MVKVRVPATSANIGCGFDTLGVALTLYATFDFEIIESGVEFVGFEERFANEKNLVYVTLQTVLRKLEKTISGVRISIQNDVPISRGLGSSSTCVVAGIYGAYLLTNTRLDKQEIFTIANEIEGHPDNVSPAIFGSLSSSCTTDDKEAVTVKYKVDERFNFLALIPDFETSTEQARKVMPEKISLKDAIYSLSRLGSVIKAFETYNLTLLNKVMGNKIHEPYRKRIIHEYQEVKEICEKVDSKGFFISGSGSTLMNIVECVESIEKIKEDLAKLKYNWRPILLKVDTEGTVVI